ncbi:DUF2380 domain-containing protein [Chelativorans salis]|uniref:DUF2380 domain-containing protein n=1 Tax=Chelativorans salis TaxID=2978478 RepID=UPI003CC6D387
MGSEGEAPQSVPRPWTGRTFNAGEKSDAGYLLIGEVHKMSTLVGWVKFAVLDLNSNRPVCDRFLSYRGDNDEAWRQAAAFAVRDIERHCIPK